jgi:hypothetical protein
VFDPAPSYARSRNVDGFGFHRRILTEHHGYRIAVIMNEFGDTAVRPPKFCLTPNYGSFVSRTSNVCPTTSSRWRRDVTEQQPGSSTFRPCQIPWPSHLKSSWNSPMAVCAVASRTLVWRPLRS